jgi:hypothetical protein
MRYEDFSLIGKGYHIIVGEFQSDVASSHFLGKLEKLCYQEAFCKNLADFGFATL